MADLKGDLASLRLDRASADRPRRRRWPWLLLIAVLVAAGVVGWRARVNASIPEVELVRSRVVRPDASSPAPGVPILTASGYVVARREAVVSSKIQGRLAELRVEEGSRVQAGEVLARLENTDYAAQIARARAAITRAEAELAEARRRERLSASLNRESVLSQDELEAARSRVQVAEAAVTQAQADLQYAEAVFSNTIIRAPFAGTVVKKMAEVGESVAPIPPGVNISSSSGAVVALADLDTLEVEADVAESNVARLSADQPAIVTVEALSGRDYAAILRQIIPTADRTKATVQVKVTILEKDPAMKPEMSARVTFLEPSSPPPTGAAVGGPAPTATIVFVPEGALVTMDGATFVFEERDGRARQRSVVTAGSARQGEVQVREGLTGSESLITNPPAALRDGDAVRVRGRG